MSHGHTVNSWSRPVTVDSLSFSASPPLPCKATSSSNPFDIHSFLPPPPIRVSPSSISNLFRLTSPFLFELSLCLFTRFGRDDVHLFQHTFGHHDHLLLTRMAFQQSHQEKNKTKNTHWNGSYFRLRSIPQDEDKQETRKQHPISICHLVRPDGKFSKKKRASLLIFLTYATTRKLERTFLCVCVRVVWI